MGVQFQRLSAARFGFGSSHILVGSYHRFLLLSRETCALKGRERAGAQMQVAARDALLAKVVVGGAAVFPWQSLMNWVHPETMNMVVALLVWGYGPILQRVAALFSGQVLDKSFVREARLKPAGMTERACPRTTS